MSHNTTLHKTRGTKRSRETTTNATPILTSIAHNNNHHHHYPSIVKTNHSFLFNHFLSFVDAQSLNQCELVCTIWKDVVDDLWKRNYVQTTSKLIDQTVMMDIGDHDEYATVFVSDLEDDDDNDDEMDHVFDNDENDDQPMRVNIDNNNNNNTTTTTTIASTDQPTNETDAQQPQQQQQQSSEETMPVSDSVLLWKRAYHMLSKLGEMSWDMEFSDIPPPSNDTTAGSQQSRNRNLRRNFDHHLLEAVRIRALHALGFFHIHSKQVSRHVTLSRFSVFIMSCTRPIMIHFSGTERKEDDLQQPTHVTVKIDMVLSPFEDRSEDDSVDDSEFSTDSKEHLFIHTVMDANDEVELKFDGDNVRRVFKTFGGELASLTTVRPNGQLGEEEQFALDFLTRLRRSQ